MSEKGYDITYEDAKKYSKYSIVFKMNIFQALKEKYKHEMTKERYNELFASKTSKETDLKMGYTPVMQGIEAIKKMVVYQLLLILANMIIMMRLKIC